MLRLYRNKGDFLFRIVEAIAVGFGTGAMFFLILATVFYYANMYYVVIVSAALAVLVVALKTKKRRMRNFAAITSSIGLGVLIGAYGFELAYFFMLVMAVYDYIAVFVTKHMLVLAKAASKSNLALLIGSSDIEVIPRSESDKRALSELRKEIKSKEISDPIIKKVVGAGELPVLSQIQLGSGDLTLPLVLSVGIFISTFSYSLAITAVIGAVAGLFATMWLLKRYNAALPAIPPLFALMNVFIGVGILVSRRVDYRIGIAMVLVGIAFWLLMILTLERKSRTGGKAGRK